MQCCQLVLEEPEQRCGVDGCGCCVWVVLGRLVAGRLAELVQKGEEGGHVDAAVAARAFVELDIVFDCE